MVGCSLFFVVPSFTGRAEREGGGQERCYGDAHPSGCPSSVSGAYLVPYFILLILIGIPLFFLELAVGQRIRRGSIGVWNYVYPQLGGIGVSSLMVTTSPFTRKHQLRGGGH